MDRLDTAARPRSQARDETPTNFKSRLQAVLQTLDEARDVLLSLSNLPNLSSSAFNSATSAKGRSATASASASRSPPSTSAEARLILALLERDVAQLDETLNVVREARSDGGGRVGEDEDQAESGVAEVTELSVLDDEAAMSSEGNLHARDEVRHVARDNRNNGDKAERSRGGGRRDDTGLSATGIRPDVASHRTSSSDQPPSSRLFKKSKPSASQSRTRAEYDKEDRKQNRVDRAKSRSQRSGHTLSDSDSDTEREKEKVESEVDVPFQHQHEPELDVSPEIFAFEFIAAAHERLMSDHILRQHESEAGPRFVELSDEEDLNVGEKREPDIQESTTKQPSPAPSRSRSRRPSPPPKLDLDFDRDLDERDFKHNAGRGDDPKRRAESRRHDSGRHRDTDRGESRRSDRRLGDLVGPRSPSSKSAKSSSSKSSTSKSKSKHVATKSIRSSSRLHDHAEEHAREGQRSPDIPSLPRTNPYVREKGDHHIEHDYNRDAQFSPPPPAARSEAARLALSCASAPPSAHPDTDDLIAPRHDRQRHRRQPVELKGQGIMIGIARALEPLEANLTSLMAFALVSREAKAAVWKVLFSELLVGGRSNHGWRSDLMRVEKTLSAGQNAAGVKTMRVDPVVLEGGTTGEAATRVRAIVGLVAAEAQGFETIVEDFTDEEWDVVALGTDWILPLDQVANLQLVFIKSKRCWWELTAVLNLLTAQRRSLKTLKLGGAAMDRNWAGSSILAKPLPPPEAASRLTALDIASVMHEDTLACILRSTPLLTTLKVGFYSIGHTDDDTPPSSIVRALEYVRESLTHLTIRAPKKKPAGGIYGLIDNCLAVVHQRLEMFEFGDIQQTPSTTGGSLVTPTVLTKLPARLRILRARDLTSWTPRDVLEMLRQPESIPALEELDLWWSTARDERKEGKRERAEILRAAGELGIRCTIEVKDGADL